MLEDVLGVKADDSCDASIGLLHRSVEVRERSLVERRVTPGAMALDRTNAGVVGRADLDVLDLIEHRDISVAAPAVLNLHSLDVG